MASIIQINGKWRAQIRKTGHRAVVRTFALEQDARAWAAEEESRIELLLKGPAGSPAKGASAYRVAGVYMLLRGREVRYIGRSTHIYRRLNDHERKAIEWDRFQIWPCRDSIRAAELERELIAKFMPTLNVALKVDATMIRKRKGRNPSNFTSYAPGAL